MLNKNMLLSKMVAAGYTQKKLAEAMKVSKNTINSKINGRSYFDTRQIETICNLLGIVSNSEKSEIFLGTISHNRDASKFE